MKKFWLRWKPRDKVEWFMAALMVLVVLCGIAQMYALWKIYELGGSCTMIGSPKTGFIYRCK